MISNMWTRILEWYWNKRFTKYKKCYDHIIHSPNTPPGKCYGRLGGDKFTDYLSYTCIDCPFHELYLPKRDKED